MSRNISLIMTPSLYKYLHFAVAETDGILELRYRIRRGQPVYSDDVRFLCDMGYLKYLGTEVLYETRGMSLKYAKKHSASHTTVKRYRVTQAGKDRLRKEGYPIDQAAA